MSGANRLINNKNTISGNDLTTLKEKLMNGNEAACEAQDAGIPTKIKGSDKKENKYKD